jgi:hypothetical protein
MRRLLYVLIVVAMLVIPASTAFAKEPPQADQISDGWWILGELWNTPDYGDPMFDVWAPFERVDAFLQRPSTCDIWNEDLGICECPAYDFVNDVCLVGFKLWPLESQAPINGTWWADLPASQERRMSYAEDYFFADIFGGYYAEFMLPRDEVWYPCSFPLKWKCNFITPTGVEFHSPAVMAYECWMEGLNQVCLAWPWRVDSSVNVCGQLGMPCDTISPLNINIYNSENIFPYGFQYQLEIDGMFWKVTDIP